jgi:MoxR-like ATPase
MKVDQLIQHARRESGLIGRDRELRRLSLSVLSGRSAVLEGPVGSGKTVLASAVAHALGRTVIRVDGDGRYTEQKLSGGFDPSAVMAKGYVPEAFIPGPLVRAMKEGAVLFVNELNRMPESVQNVLLPALDEGKIQVPQLGEIKAAPGFLMLATQNPREFVATSHLSEAMLDRLDWIPVPYPFEEEERAILARVPGVQEDVRELALALVRLTRHFPKIKRGASVRAGLALLELVAAGAELWEAARIALPTRIELQPGMVSTGVGLEGQMEALLLELAAELKKNS